ADRRIQRAQSDRPYEVVDGDSRSEDQEHEKQHQAGAPDLDSPEKENRDQRGPSEENRRRLSRQPGDESQWLRSVGLVQSAVKKNVRPHARPGREVGKKRGQEDDVGTKGCDPRKSRLVPTVEEEKRMEPSDVLGQ